MACVVVVLAVLAVLALLTLPKDSSLFLAIRICTRSSAAGVLDLSLSGFGNGGAWASSSDAGGGGLRSLPLGVLVLGTLPPPLSSGGGSCDSTCTSMGLGCLWFIISASWAKVKPKYLASS